MVYLGVGTNLGNKEKNLHDALERIENRIGRVVSLSDFYSTAPWGFASDNSFLNAVVCIESSLSPLAILQQTQAIERELGRKEKSNEGTYQDRLIDIDLLLYHDLIWSSEALTLPHPLMAERRFVLEPLAAIAPNLLHPVLQRTIRELLQNLLAATTTLSQ